MAIKVTYRRTSRLSMRIVKNGDVHVSAPIGMPREKVIAFIEEHKDWIEQARKKTYERQKQRTEFYNKLPLTTRAQADEALKRLKALVEPMMEKHAKNLPWILKNQRNHPLVSLQVGDLLIFEFRSTTFTISTVQSYFYHCFYNGFAIFLAFIFVFAIFIYIFATEIHKTLITCGQNLVIQPY